MIISKRKKVFSRLDVLNCIAFREQLHTPSKNDRKQDKKQNIAP